MLNLRARSSMLFAVARAAPVRRTQQTAKTMSSTSSEIVFTPAVKTVQVKCQSPTTSRRQHMPQMVRAEDVARTLMRLQMRIRELEAELTALKAAPAGWR
jgi:hypothetical protein